MGTGSNPRPSRFYYVVCIQICKLYIYIYIKNQCIRQKTGAQNTVQEIKQYQEKWLQHVQRMDTGYQNKHYNINQTDEET